MLDTMPIELLDIEAVAVAELIVDTDAAILIVRVSIWW